MMDDEDQVTGTPLIAQPTTKPQQNVQERFLSTLCKGHVPVYIYLVNGIKLQGCIKSFDQYVVYLEHPVPQIVYKRSICSVMRVHASKTPDQVNGSANGAISGTEKDADK